MNNPIVAEYQSQPWVMEPTALQTFIGRIASLSADAGIFAIQVTDKPAELSVEFGVARVSIAGYLLNKVPAWMRAWGITATSYNQIRSQLAEATERKDVNSIELLVNSPGGMVAGVIGAADAIYEARQVKTVTAVIESLGASGAYWLASQAETIVADDANTAVGSIGVYTYYVDWSKYEEKVGVKVIVIRSGEHKGTGLDQITDSQIAAAQEYIDATADNFISQVARGRSSAIDTIAELATGQLWIAGAARERGLIDAVQQSPQANESIGSAEITTEFSQGANPMKEKHETEAVDVEAIEAAAGKSALDTERARVTAIQKEFADDPQFAMTACAEDWSLEKAKGEYCDVLKTRLAEKPKAAAAAAVASGHAPIGSDDSDAASEGSDFMAEALAMADDKGISKTEAMKKLARQKPELHAAFRQQCESSGSEMYATAR